MRVLQPRRASTAAACRPGVWRRSRSGSPAGPVHRHRARRDSRCRSRGRSAGGPGPPSSRWFLRMAREAGGPDDQVAPAGLVRRLAGRPHCGARPSVPHQAKIRPAMSAVSNTRSRAARAGARREWRRTGRWCRTRSHGRSRRACRRAPAPRRPAPGRSRGGAVGLADADPSFVTGPDDDLGAHPGLAGSAWPSPGPCGWRRSTSPRERRGRGVRRLLTLDWHGSTFLVGLSALTRLAER